MAGRQILVMALAELGDFRSGCARFADLAREQSGFPDAWISLGNACLQCGDATAVVDAFGGSAPRWHMDCSVACGVQQL